MAEDSFCDTIIGEQDEYDDSIFANMGRYPETSTMEYVISVLENPKVPMLVFYNHFTCCIDERDLIENGGWLDMQQVYDHITFIRSRFHKLKSYLKCWNEDKFVISQVDPALMIAHKANLKGEGLYRAAPTWDHTFISEHQFQTLKKYCNSKNIPLEMIEEHMNEQINPIWVYKMLQGNLPGSSYRTGDCTWLGIDGKEHHSWESFLTIFSYSVLQGENLERFRFCRTFHDWDWAEVIEKYGTDTQKQWYTSQTSWTFPLALQY